MDINQYQRESHATALYPSQGTLVGQMYCGLGLTGEAGEVADIIKKAYRDEVFHPQDLKLELGDVQWYIAELATTNRWTMDEVLTANLNKLASRRERHVIQGSGDHR